VLVVKINMSKYAQILVLTFDFRANF
jgi:hypothetical protein